MAMASVIVDNISLRSGISSVATIEDARAEELSNFELRTAVENLTTSNHNLTLDNLILETYLEKVDPVAAAGLQQLLDQAATSVAIHSRIQAATSMMANGAPSSASLWDSSSEMSSSPRPSRLSYSVMKFGTVVSSADRGGPRINVNQKMEMVDKLIDEARDDFVKMKARSQQCRINIHAELEESHLMLQELKESEEALEARVVRGMDQLTGRIPAEKFVRHMEDWLKKADMTIEKLRLRACTLRSQNIRIQQQLVQKEELGESIHPVDFIQLQIENKILIQKLERRNFHLLGLKKVTGRSALLLTNHKKQLMEKVNKLVNLRSTVAERDAQMEAFLNEGDRVAIELEKADDIEAAMRDMMSKYTVPKLLDYIKKNAELYELRKAVKIWSRRKNIQQTAIKACNYQLSQMPVASQKRLTEKLTTDAFNPSTTNPSKTSNRSGSKSNMIDRF